MKVLLINSPIYDKKVADKEDFLPPLGLGYIASNLKEENVEIIDAVYQNLTVEEILEQISIKKPDFVGINIFSINYELVKKIIENCKLKTTFIIGAKSTRFLYKDIINFNTPNKIIVTIGEGELITKDIVHNCVKEEPFYNNQNRTIYKVDNNSIYLPQTLEEVKLDRNLFTGRAILNHYGKVEEPIVTSRECLYNCAFCGGARSLNSDVRVRTRSKEDIIKELQWIERNNPNCTCIRILDDLFLKNRKSIIDAIEIFSKFNFSFRAMAHAMSFENSKDLLPLLKESGCLEIEMGIESGSDTIRKQINKNGSVKLIKETIMTLLDNDINVKGYFMYGLPNETEKECLETYNLAKELTEYSYNTNAKFKTSAFQFRPYHGTELYNKINEKIEYTHDDELNSLPGRKQFNFTAGNYSNCDDETIKKLIIETNELGNTYENRRNKKM